MSPSLVWAAISAKAPKGLSIVSAYISPVHVQVHLQTVRVLPTILLSFRLCIHVACRGGSNILIY